MDQMTAAGLTVEDVMNRLESGSLRPGPSYDGMTREEIARNYLRRCKKAGVCAGCYNDLDEEDRVIIGEATNICIVCACS